MTSAAIAGNYAEFKLVKTRGVFAITIEFAVERTAEVFAALGYPQPGTEIPVAVARLRKEVMPVGSIQEHTRTIDTPPSSQTLGAGAQGIPERATAVDPERKPPEAHMEVVDGAGGSSEADPAARGGGSATSRSRMPGDTGKAGRAGEAGGSPAPPVAPEGDENRGARAVKRAGILCMDEQFQHWFGVQGDSDAIAAVLREELGIKSRRDLAHDERARERFEALVTEFDIWRGRIAEVRG